MALASGGRPNARNGNGASSTHPDATGARTPNSAPEAAQTRDPPLIMASDNGTSGKIAGENRTLQRLLAVFRRSISTNEARANFSEVIGKVAYGNEWVALNRRGKTIALMVPL